jgi:hypothetical protein
MERKREVWLTLYGVFLALLIQVIYDWAGFLGTMLRLAIGLGIACCGLIPLAIFATNSFHWKKQSDKPNDSKKNLQIEMLRLQLKYDSLNSVMTLILSLEVALLAVFATITFSGVFPKD